MQEKPVAGAPPRERGEAAPVEEIRVTDRRRINLDAEPGAGSSPEAEGASPRLVPSYVEELEARTRAAEQKMLDVQGRFDQLRAQMQRETDETRQRLNRAADERAARSKADFVTALLPVLDNLRRALEAAREGSSLEALVNGLQGTVSGFENALAAAGAEPVGAAGETFDPELHEAVDTIEVGPERDGIVTQEYSRGYRIGNRLLRPARVQVGRARTTEDARQQQSAAE